MILIVDDKPENIFAIRSILSQHNFPSDTALSGEEALKKVLKNSYALIILDVQMPGMDGFEVAETISGYSKSKDIPIIFLSAVNTDKKYIAKGYSSGGIDYISKPIDPDIFLLKVKTFYTLYEQKRQLNEMQASLLAEIEFRKKAQDEVNDLALEFKSILESIPQIAFTTKADGHIEYNNSRWFEYSTSEIEFPVAHPDDADIKNALQQTIKRGQPLEMEVRIKKLADEDYRYHLLKVLPVKENGEIVKWVGTFTDIEDQKQAIKKKDEFISIASHELKTPLTSIKGYIQLLQHLLDGNENAARQYIDRTLIQVEKLNILIADLLDISKIESGKLKYNMKNFDLEGMLGNAVEIIQQTYPDYTIEREGGAARQVYGDEIRLEQVIINFLSNAVKYSPDARKVTVLVTEQGGETKVSVKDSGIGISKKDQQHIFNKFYRAEKSEHHIQGLGIGLYICAEILRRHNFGFGVESEPGKGSEFYFTMPTGNSAR
ncbi:ATP-binding response regulator [Foetidibacter luteolus]|uniref:ATP-binding response regulator n=1 Tax=Foetidibacter luteolus TaxID=2608880 RepID=UPI00129B93A1|nr:ATP-binding protein [Foetidibacter luteolus]